MNRNKLFTKLGGFLAVTAFATLAQAASVTPNTTQDLIDTPECTLREAIASVNLNSAIGGCTASDGSTIDTVELPAGAYVLSLTGLDDNNNAGDLDVLANLTLNGAGLDTTSISAQGLNDNGSPERVLHIDPQGDALTVGLNGVTIQDGLEDGDGGGVLIEGSILELPVGDIKLGVPDNITSATFTDMAIVDNESSEEGGGIMNSNASLILNNVLVADNSAVDNDGGGIASFVRGQPPLGLTVQNSIIENNQGRFGGGISVSGTLAIDSTTIAGNDGACVGGGLVFEGSALITKSTISDNAADGPCLINLGDEDPDTNVGGGIATNSQSSLDIINSTLSGNSAPNGGGGIAIAIEPVRLQPIEGSGLSETPGTRLFNVTIADNQSDGIGGGAAIFTIEPTLISVVFSLSNTIIANNSAAESPDCFGDFASNGYNLVEDTAGCNGFTVTGDQTGIDPDLGPLQDNGGPTATQALNLGSPAIDTANPDGCVDDVGATLASDQRLETRPVNATGLATAICDIGAFEFQIPEPSPTPTPTVAPGFLLNGTGCALTEQVSAASSAPAILLLAGLVALSYRSFRRREE